MIVGSLLAVVFHQTPKLQVVETKLLSLQKTKLVPNSIYLSPNFEHFAYKTPDGKVMIDGKAFGPYVFSTPVIYSGDGKDYAFAATVKAGEDAKFFWNGVEKKTEFPISNVFRAGDSGPICWTERDKETTKVRLITPYETTGWFEKIDRINFNDDGSNFYLRTVEKVVKEKDAPNDPSQPDSRDYIIYKGGKKVARESILQVYIAPKDGGFAAVRPATSLVGLPSGTIGGLEVITRAGSTIFRGEIFGNPVYSSDGKQFAFRSRYTVPGTVANQDRIQYFLNGKQITELNLQSGLMFSDTSDKWAMCGLNDKRPYLLTSWGGLVSYGEFPLLGGAPSEPYKFGRFVNDKMVLLFQARRSKPLLFIEDKAMIELGPYSALTDTISISPDGKLLAVAGTDGTMNHAYLVDLQNPVAGVETLKGPYELQVTGDSTFAWQGEHDLKFAVLRKNDLCCELLKL